LVPGDGVARIAPPNAILATRIPGKVRFGLTPYHDDIEGDVDHSTGCPDRMDRQPNPLTERHTPADAATDDDRPARRPGVRVPRTATDPSGERRRDGLVGFDRPRRGRAPNKLESMRCPDPHRLEAHGGRWASRRDGRGQAHRDRTGIPAGART